MLTLPQPVNVEPFVVMFTGFVLFAGIDDTIVAMAMQHNVLHYCRLALSTIYCSGEVQFVCFDAPCPCHASDLIRLMAEVQGMQSLSN